VITRSRALSQSLP